MIAATINKNPQKVKARTYTMSFGTNDCCAPQHSARGVHGLLSTVIAVSRPLSGPWPPIVSMRVQFMSPHRELSALACKAALNSAVVAMHPTIPPCAVIISSVDSQNLGK